VAAVSAVADPELANALSLGVGRAALAAPFQRGIESVISIQGNIDSHQLNALDLAQSWLPADDGEAVRENMETILNSDLSPDLRSEILRHHLGRSAGRDLAETVKLMNELLPPGSMAGTELAAVVKHTGRDSLSELPSFLIDRHEAGDPGSSRALHELGVRWAKQDPNAIGNFLAGVEKTNK